MKRTILEGGRFGRWVVKELIFGSRSALCVCDCGTEKHVFKCHLSSGKSLGCRHCRDKSLYVKHGLHKTATYRTWSNMKNRCLNPKCKDFHNYGGRGILFDDSWADFYIFLSDMGIRPNGMTLDRIDNNKGYSKDNCRWAAIDVQSNNTRVNRIVEYEGQPYTIAQLSEHLGLRYGTLYSRIANGTQVDRPLRITKK